MNADAPGPDASQRIAKIVASALEHEVKGPDWPGDHHRRQSDRRLHDATVYYTVLRSPSTPAGSEARAALDRRAACCAPWSAGHRRPVHADAGIRRGHGARRRTADDELLAGHAKRTRKWLLANGASHAASPTRKAARSGRGRRGVGDPLASSLRTSTSRTIAWSTRVESR